MWFVITLVAAVLLLSFTVSYLATRLLDTLALNEALKAEIDILDHYIANRSATWRD
jgi:hypothetical protein